MTTRNRQLFSRFAFGLFLLFALLFAVACRPAVGTGGEPDAQQTEEMEEEMGQDSEHDEDAVHEEGDDHEHDGEGEDADHEHNDDQAEDRVPNEGAVIRIVSPADGATFAVGEQIVVEIEAENFELGQDNNHWHVYVDGVSWGMVVGENTDEVLSGIEPGEHEISVYLSIGTHEELEDGDSITVSVEE